MAENPGRGRPGAIDADESRLVDAALELAALQGWSATRMSEIAERAGMTPAAARRRLPTRMAILAAFSRRVDDAVAAGGEADIEDSVRDRLFDVMMRRFDQLSPHRDALKSIARDLACRPPRAACYAGGPLRRSMERMLDAAAVPSWGPLRPLQVKGLGVVYLSVLRVFLGDDSADLSRTMAALDRALGRADELAAMLPGRARRSAPSREAAA